MHRHARHAPPAVPGAFFRRAPFAGATLAFVATVALAGCPAAEDADGPGSKHDLFDESGIKADCFDCDPSDLRSAFEQADLGRTGFYRRGTSWQVAYQFHVERSHERHLLGPGETRQAGAAGDVYLFDYRVARLSNRIFGDYRRPVAHIEIYQSPEVAPYTGLVADGRLDAHEYQMEVLVNDLFEGVAKVYYNERYPNGRYVELSDGARVRSLTDPFPADVPNVTVADTETRALPALSPALTAVAEKAAELGRLPADWNTRTYRYFTFGFEDGTEEVYWAPGDLWPSYVRTPRGDALLIRQIEEI
jgi:hypothetical protein